MMNTLRVLLMIIYTTLAQKIGTDCDGKAFYCVDEAHFQICVYTGIGTSTVEEFVIPCPLETECLNSNQFECEPNKTTTQNFLHYPTFPSVEETVSDQPFSQYDEKSTAEVTYSQNSSNTTEFFFLPRPEELTDKFIPETSEVPSAGNLSTKDPVADITNYNTNYELNIYLENTSEPMKQETTMDVQVTSPMNLDEITSTEYFVDNSKNNSYTDAESLYINSKINNSLSTATFESSAVIYYNTTDSNESNISLSISDNHSSDTTPQHESNKDTLAPESLNKNINESQYDSSKILNITEFSQSSNELQNNTWIVHSLGYPPSMGYQEFSTTENSISKSKDILNTAANDNDTKTLTETASFTELFDINIENANPPEINLTSLSNYQKTVTIVSPNSKNHTHFEVKEISNHSVVSDLQNSSTHKYEEITNQSIMDARHNENSSFSHESESSQDNQHKSIVSDILDITLSVTHLGLSIEKTEFQIEESDVTSPSPNNTFIAVANQDNIYLSGANITKNKDANVSELEMISSSEAPPTSFAETEILKLNSFVTKNLTQNFKPSVDSTRNSPEAVDISYISFDTLQDVTSSVQLVSNKSTHDLNAGQNNSYPLHDLNTTVFGDSKSKNITSLETTANAPFGTKELETKISKNSSVKYDMLKREVPAKAKSNISNSNGNDKVSIDAVDSLNTFDSVHETYQTPTSIKLNHNLPKVSEFHNNSTVGTFNNDSNISHERTINAMNSDTNLIFNIKNFNFSLKPSPNDTNFELNIFASGDFKQTKVSNTKATSDSVLVLNFHSSLDQNKAQYGEIVFNNSNVGILLENIEKRIVFNCNGKMRGRYKHVTNDNMYYVCIGKSQPIIASCGENQVFDELTSKCINISTSNEFKCHLEGNFVDKSSNNSYFKCVKHNDTFIRYHFKCKLGFIVEAVSVRCINGTAPRSSHSSNITIKNEKIKAYDYNEIRFECRSPGKFPDPNNSRKYYVCILKRRNKFRKRHVGCESEEIFDSKKGKCKEIDDG